MDIDNDYPVAPFADADYAWLEDTIAANSREDRIAEIVAVLALVFSIGVGLVIALLPVTVKATSIELHHSASAIVASDALSAPTR